MVQIGIRWHGAGFHQVILSEHLRFHVWLPGYPPTAPHADIHNHRYELHSTVLRGAIIEDQYDVYRTYAMDAPARLHKIKGGEPAAEGVLCGVDLQRRRTIREGERYVVPSNSYFFHRTTALGVTVTLVYRGKLRKGVCAIVNTDVDNPPQDAFGVPGSHPPAYAAVEACLRETLGLNTSPDKSLLARVGLDLAKAGADKTLVFTRSHI